MHPNFVFWVGAAGVEDWWGDRDQQDGQDFPDGPTLTFPQSATVCMVFNSEWKRMHSLGPSLKSLKRSVTHIYEWLVRGQKPCPERAHEPPSKPGLVRDNPSHKWLQSPLYFLTCFWVNHFNTGF